MCSLFTRGLPTCKGQRTLSIHIFLLPKCTISVWAQVTADIISCSNFTGCGTYLHILGGLIIPVPPTPVITKGLPRVVWVQELFFCVWFWFPYWVEASTYSCLCPLWPSALPPGLALGGFRTAEHWVKSLGYSIEGNPYSPPLRFSFMWRNIR